MEFRHASLDRHLLLDWDCRRASHNVEAEKELEQTSDATEAPGSTV